MFARLNIYFIAGTRICRKNSVTTELLRREKYFYEPERLSRLSLRTWQRCEILRELSKAKIAFMQESEHGQRQTFCKSIKNGEKKKKTKPAKRYINSHFW